MKGSEIMKFFIDTANTDEIRKAYEMGVIDGVTTNPSLISKENRDFESLIKEICQILPGMKSPTILPLAEEGWCSLHSVVKEDEFWDRIDQLKNAGAEGILVIPIEKMVL